MDTSKLTLYCVLFFLSLKFSTNYIAIIDILSSIHVKHHSPIQNILFYFDIYFLVAAAAATNFPRQGSSVSDYLIFRAAFKEL